jgi:hypothetical protein
MADVNLFRLRRFPIFWEPPLSLSVILWRIGVMDRWNSGIMDIKIENNRFAIFLLLYPIIPVSSWDTPVGAKPPEVLHDHRVTKIFLIKVSGLQF